jgi:hypothetical protein
MTNDELAARIVVLEAMTMASLGAAVRFGRAVLPPESVILILDEVKNAARLRIQQEGLSSGGMAEAEYASGEGRLADLRVGGKS